MRDSIPEGFQDVFPKGMKTVDHPVRRLEEEVGQGWKEGWRSLPLHETLTTMHLYATAACKTEPLYNGARAAISEEPPNTFYSSSTFSASRIAYSSPINTSYLSLWPFILG